MFNKFLYVLYSISIWIYYVAVEQNKVDLFELIYVYFRCALVKIASCKNFTSTKILNPKKHKTIDIFLYAHI